MYLQKDAHPGYEYKPALHSWVACANNVTFNVNASQYFWYQVAACANANESMESCIAKVPKAAVEPVQACRSDASRASSLVAAMHAIGDSVNDFPTILINGKTSASIPEPDTHGDAVGPLIKEICNLSKHVKKLPPACTLNA